MNFSRMRPLFSLSIATTFSFVFLLMLFSIFIPQVAADENDLIITGVFDGPLQGGTPKGIELYAVNDIADLSEFGVGSANNGGGSNGEEFTFPADAVTAGSFIYVASEAIEFANFFGFAPDYTTSAVSINGDDAIELFYGGSVSDVFGDINTDGTGEPWEYMDGWAYRVDNTGPDGSTFVLNSWTFSGPNALDNETSNDTATTPFPLGTFSYGTPDTGLGIAKTVQPNTNVSYLGTVTYTVILSNSGSVPETAVLFTDTLPISTTFGSWVEQPVGAAESGNEITWSGTVTNGEAITFTFTADQTAGYGDTITNTAEFSGTTAGSAQAAFTVGTLSGDITFVYHDLEDVVLPGETVYIAGTFNGWSDSATPMLADAGFETFSVTIPALSTGVIDYKYIVNDGASQWNWLNTDNRNYTVAGTATVDDYRNVVSGWENLDEPATLVVTQTFPTEAILGQLYINGVTEPAGEGRGILAQNGFGNESDPSLWTWFDAAYSGDNGNNDIFQGSITPTIPGVYSFTNRFNGNWGSGNPNSAWTYGDLTGTPFELANTGVLTVNIETVPIATARAGNVGETFAVEGTVTYVPGTFSYPGWALQDASGGIAVYDSGLVPTVNYGDVVQIIGNRGAYNGEEQLGSISYFNNLGPGAEVTPIVTTTNALDSGSVEGWIVEIQGTISDLSDCNGNYSFNVDDGSGIAAVYVDQDTGIDVCNLGGANGEEIQVVGFATEYNGSHQLKPRRSSDVAVLLDTPIVISTTPENNATGVLTDTVISIEFNIPVTVTASWFDINCSISGSVSGSFTPVGPASSYTITPTTNFATGDLCNVTVAADQVTGSSASMVTDHTFSFQVGTLDFGTCYDPAIPIHFVQGDGLTSPLAGSRVVVEGVVVGDYQTTLNGYYVQEENDEFDSDTMTSEGIFVYDTQSVDEGDVVRVEGTVVEYAGMTEISSLANHAVCGMDTVTPTIVTLPLAEGDDWEFYEGMLIAIEDELTVTNSYLLGRYGQVQLGVNGRLAQPTNVVTPGLAANALQELNSRSFVTIDDGNPLQNVDPIVQPMPQLTFTNTLRGGDVAPNGLVGVVDEYNNDSSDDYRVFPTEEVVFNHTNTRQDTPTDVGGNMRVASFNVLNYFSTIDDGGAICGPSQDMNCRGADTAEEFARQRIKIINAIIAMDADVVGLMEMENHHLDAALQDLIQGLNDAAGAGTYDYIDTGVIGTDAIKVALIYQPAKVTPVGTFAILDNSFDPGYQDNRNRPSLAQTFANNDTNEQITISVSHLKSKGCRGAAGDDADQGDGQGCWNNARNTAAEILTTWLGTNPTNSNTERFLIMGDLNSYAMEDPIQTIEDAGYTNLVSLFQGADAYGYSYDGQWGYLDHALASADLLPLVNNVADWHINADEPIAFDYNMEYKTANQHVILYGEEPYRASDHDPVVVGITLPAMNITSPTAGEVFISTDGTAVSVPVTITTTDFAIPTDGHWHIWVDGVDMGAVMAYDTTVDLLPGTHVITAELNSPSHTPLGIVDSVTVTVTVNTQHTVYLPVLMKP